MPFIANLEPKEGFPLNVVTLEVQVLEEQGDELIVLTSEGVKAGVKRQFVWDSELEARIGARRGRYVYLRQKIGRALISGDLPRAPLRPAMQIRLTSNPLRMGERNRIFGAQGNTFHKEVTLQKVLQLLSVAREALLSLAGLLELAIFTNDFTKKLLAKYIIVELSTMMTLFKGLSRLDDSYRAAEYRDLVRSVRRLDKKNVFRRIRNKLGAHLDADLDLAEYVSLWAAVSSDKVFAFVNVIEDHLIALMKSRYPHEYVLYFLASEKDVLGISEVAHAPTREYVPFDGLDL